MKLAYHFLSCVNTCASKKVQVNCAQWEINGARTEQNRERLAEICAVSSKGIVIIGNTVELDD
jgi:hypothetical protein